MQKEQSPSPEIQDFTQYIPEGYQERDDNIAGYWDMSFPVHFVPQEVHLSDSQLEPRKVSVLIIGQLASPCVVVKDEQQVQAQGGERVGVWYKPGMKALLNLGGVSVFMFLSGELDTGKPSKMKTFKIASKNTGFALTVTGDYRRESKTAIHPLSSQSLGPAPTRREGNGAQRGYTPDPDDEVAF